MVKCLHCDRPAHARRLCTSHYANWRKRGDPLIVKGTPRISTDRVSRFWMKVDRRGPADCWPWTANTHRGYGMYANGRGGMVRAHVFSWELANGPRPTTSDSDPWTVDHTCHTTVCPGGVDCPHRRCVNPGHLRLVPNLINMAAGNSFAAVNARKTICRWGHPLVEGSYYQYGKRRHCKACARLAARGLHPRQLAH